MDTNSNDTKTAGLPDRVGVERPTDMVGIIKALQDAHLPLDAALGFVLAEIGLVLVHRAGESRWEAAGEICADINRFDEYLGDWIYGPWDPMPEDYWTTKPFGAEDGTADSAALIAHPRSTGESGKSGEI